MTGVKTKYDYIVVGSGVGGGTLVRELSRQGKEVLCVEWGFVPHKTGEMMDCRNLYDFKRLPDFFPKTMQRIPLTPPTTSEGIVMWRAITAGGTSVISLGNGARCMENELKSMGIDLMQEYAETEAEIGLRPLGRRLLSKGSRRIRDAAEVLGHEFLPMPKYIDQPKCLKCHKCLYGCRYHAKWDTRAWLREAADDGADFLYQTQVKEIVHSQGRVRGIRAKNTSGRIDIQAGTVILAAGGMATPVLLQNSGVKEAGGGFFLDLFRNTYGMTQERGLNQDKEPNMAMVDLEWICEEGFLLSPYMNHDRLTRLQEMHPVRAMRSSNNMLGIMTKITDDANGRVYSDGKCSKPLTRRDLGRLDKGARLAREILVQAGAKPDSLFESKIQGAHPGGAAAIGTVVDTDLQTRIDNLFVCDASVFPAQRFNHKSRLPPIVTIVSLAKRLAKTLN
jgi:choline dehydrogenase-like flavoprotein